MKLISVEEAKDQFADFCDQALSGEIIRVQSKNGELELTPVPRAPKLEPLTQEDLAASYEDSDWAAFENNTGKASD
jgi:hypothetical protein